MAGNLEKLVSIFLILQIYLSNSNAKEVTRSIQTMDLVGCCTSKYECEEWMANWNFYKNRKNPLWFRLEPQSQQCGNEDMTKISLNVFEHQDLNLNDTVTIIGNDVDSGESFKLTFNYSNERVKFSLEGEMQPSLQISKSAYCLRKTIPSERQEQNINTNADAQIEICHSRNQYLSYRKCCPEGQGLGLLMNQNETAWHCTPLDRSGGNQTYKADFPPFSRESRQFSKKMEITPVVGMPKCGVHKFQNFISTALLALDYPLIPYILKNDKIKYKEQSAHNGISSWSAKSVSAEEYCVDHVIMADEYADNTCPGEEDVLVICESHAETNSRSLSPIEIEFYGYAYVACLLVAILFLGATALGQILLKEIRNIHNWTVQSYVLCQLLFYIFLVIIYLNQQSQWLPKGLCMAIGIMAHYFGICTFSFLSIINFDLFWTFRVLQPTSQTSIPWKKLIWYLLFATALPFLIVGGTVAYHFYDQQEAMCRSTFETASNSWFPHPGYGNKLCFLSNSAQLTYFYLPVGVLLLANLIFYSCTSYRLCSIYKKNQNDSFKKHKESCELLLKLFFVMGTVWIFQVLHAAIEPHERKWYWTITDILGFFQAIAIFVIFMCKRETARALEIKYPFLRGLCCRFERLYRRPTITDRSTDGSTKISRTDYQRKSSMGHQHEWQEPNEIIQLPARAVDLITLNNSNINSPSGN